MTSMRASKRVVRGFSRALAVGERVFLRQPTGPDREEFVALRDRNKRFLQPWEPRPVDGMKFFGPAAFDRLLRSVRSGDACRMLLCLRSTGQIMGAVNLNQIARGPFQSCTMGYWIGREFTRQGYMAEAVKLAVAHAFGELGLHRVEANIIPRNEPSRALIQACGFRFEGLAKRYLQINGRWEDHEHWAMTVEDWRRPNPKI
jgi:[ribosomal protein S5]-alanine N-acetyltransferase